MTLVIAIQGLALLAIAWLTGRVPQPQTLGLGAELQEQTEARAPRNGRDFGLLGGILFLPLLFLIALFSLPVTFVAAYFQRRRERAFFLQMQARSRVVPWTDFRRAAEESHGTLIREWYSLKGPVRWWWTSENIYDESVEPIAQAETGSYFDEYNRPFSEWVRQRYTDQNSGSALLVADRRVRKDEAHSLWLALSLNQSAMKWIEVAPPENLRVSRDKPRR